MGDLFRDGATWLAQMRARHCASPITYRRGDETYVVSATFAGTRYDVTDEYGVRTGATATAFLVAAAEFPLDEPLAGDQVVADGVVYTVVSLSGQGAWRWTDPFRTTLRIHAKETGV